MSMQSIVKQRASVLFDINSKKYVHIIEMNQTKENKISYYNRRQTSKALIPI